MYAIVVDVVTSASVPPVARHQKTIRTKKYSAIIIGAITVLFDLLFQKSILAVRQNSLYRHLMKFRSVE
nr:MAG TPA: hypothetical protein [Caudoviricetes sp.]